MSFDNGRAPRARKELNKGIWDRCVMYLGVPLASIALMLLATKLEQMNKLPNNEVKKEQGSMCLLMES